MNIAPIFIIGLPILLVLAVGLVGSTRRLGFWLSLIAAIFLTPIGGLILAVISGPKRRKRASERRNSSGPQAT